jgi:hypothetical protein
MLCVAAANASKVSVDSIRHVTMPRALPGKVAYLNPTISAILPVKGSWMLGESTKPGLFINSRKTVVIRFGEICGADTSP